MSKLALGMLVGAVLGFFDGVTAWFTPEARPMLMGIIIGSTVKGFLAGLAAGFVARRTGSMTGAVITGLVVGLHPQRAGHDGLAGGAGALLRDRPARHSGRGYRRLRQR